MPRDPNIPDAFDVYTLILLRRPADAPEMSETELDALQAQHLAYRAQLRRQGVLVVNGPLGEQSDVTMRGLSIFACDINEAKRLSDGDPSVQAGRLAYDVMEWWVAADSLAFPDANRPVGERRRSRSEEASMKDTQKSATGAAARDEAVEGWTDEERAAMQERNRELKAAARRRSKASKEDGERDVLAKIAEMPGSDRAMAERLHALVKANAPALAPRTWYGMPAYAKDGKVLCFFQAAEKFKARYASFGFTDEANLDDGAMWPVSFALKELTAPYEAKIAALVRKSVS